MFTKADKNYLLNMALVIISTVCIFTGIFYNDNLRFAHEISGYLMAILLLGHLILHARWIKGATRSILSDKKKLLALSLTVLFSLGICFALFMNNHTNRHERDGFRRQFRDSQIYNEQNQP